MWMLMWVWVARIQRRYRRVVGLILLFWFYCLHMWCRRSFDEGTGRGWGVPSDIS